MNGQEKENAVIEDKETLAFEDFDLDSLENQLEEELESQLSDLEFIKSEKEKIGNPDALGKVVMDEVWKQFTNQIGLEVTNETLIQKYDREHPETYEEVGKTVMQDQKYKDANKAMKEKQKAGNLKDEYTGKDLEQNDSANLDHVVARKELYENKRRRQASIQTEDLANKDENLKPTNESLNKSKNAKSMDDYLSTQEERKKSLIEQNEKANKKIDESNMSDLEKQKPKEKNNKRLQDKLDADEELMKTEFTQPAILTASVAVSTILREHGLTPDVVAGHSLGEYSALVTAGALSFSDAIHVVHLRGKYMQEAVPLGEGGMAAIIALDAESIKDICNTISTEEKPVQAVNFNCPGQVVIAGATEAVKQACNAMKEAGAKRVLPLKVSGPFHSPMLKPAGEKLLDVLADVEVDDPTVPYVSNTTAEFITSKDEVKELLGRQVYSSVCWEQSIEKMIADGADTFVEIGPGRTLCGFMRKIDRNVKAINIAKVEDLEKLKEIM